MKKLLHITILGLCACLAGWAQCGPSGHIIFNAISGTVDCTANAGAGTGTVTSVGLVSASTARLTVTGASPILAAGTWTIDIANPFVFPGTATFGAGTTGAPSFNVPSGVAPTTPTAGDFWNASGALRFYDGSATQSLLYQSRNVSTTSPLGGGGALTGDLTLTCATCTTNAAALTANQLVIGGGLQAAAALGSLGTTTTLLHGNAGGAPTFGNVADGDFGANLLGVAHGGTNLATYTSGGIICATGTTTLAASALLTANMPLIGGGAGVCPSVGTVTGNTTLFVTSTGAQTANAIPRIDASGNHVAGSCTQDSSGNVVCPGGITAGNASGDTSFVKYVGHTSGGLIMTVADVAGTLSGMLFSNPTGVTTDTFLRMHGSTTCPTNGEGIFTGVTCYLMDFASPAGSGTVNSGTIHQIGVYAANGTAISGDANLTETSGTVNIGVDGSVQGVLTASGSTSSHTTLAFPASGGGTATFPAGTYNVGTDSTSQTLTNKTIDCASNTCTIPAANRIRAIAFVLGDPNGSALGTTAKDYVTVPFACTISAYNLMFDAADATAKVKFWKVATGTAIPTVSNSISTSGVGVASGTAIHSTTVSDFTTTTVSANDMIAMNLATANTVKFVSGVLECDQ